MKFGKKDIFLRDEYGYFFKNEEQKDIVYAGIYNKDKTKVYLISENKFVDTEKLTDIFLAKIKSFVDSNGEILIQNSEPVRNIQITNPDLLGVSDRPWPASYVPFKISHKISFFNFESKDFCEETIYYKKIEIGYIYSFRNNKPDYSCNIRIMLINEKTINQGIEKVNSGKLNEYSFLDKFNN